MKKFFAFCLAILLILGSLSSYAEAVQPEEESALEFDDTKSADNGKGVSPMVAKAMEGYKRGFHIALKAPQSPAGLTPLYTANVGTNIALRDVTDENTFTRLENVPEGGAVTIYQVEPNWALVQYGDCIGWLKRIHLIEGSIAAIDPANTMPYGVQKPRYTAKLTEATFIYNEPSTDSVPFKVPVEKDAKFAILDFVDGFAKIIVWRDYGYIDAKLLTDIQMVSPTDEPLSADTPIAAYHSIFEHSIGKESNDARVVNIAVSTKYMTTVLQPGETFDFNKQVGPYKRTKGYQAAPVLINGGSQLGYGGGTCQSSSTLYNTLLQIPQVSILHRRPHGPGSAKYLPQHQDAAVGNKALNFVFRNDYSHPLRVEAESVNGCLFIAIYKVEAELQASK